MEAEGLCNDQKMKFDCSFCKESFRIICGPKGHVFIVVSREVDTDKDKNPKEDSLMFGSFQIGTEDNRAKLEDHTYSLAEVAHSGQCEELGTGEYIVQIDDIVTSGKLDKKEDTVTCQIENVRSLEQKNQIENTQQNTEINRDQNTSAECSQYENVLEEDNFDDNDNNDDDFTALNVGEHTVIDDQMSNFTVTTESDSHKAETSGSKKPKVASEFPSKNSCMQARKDVYKDFKGNSKKIPPCRVSVNVILREKFLEKMSLWQKKMRLENDEVKKDDKYPRRKAVHTNISKSEIQANDTNVHDLKLFVCNLCNKQFWRNCTLKKHKLVVHQNIKYKCNVCSKSFSEKHQLKTHVDFVHEGIKRLVCQMCERPFGTIYSLFQHQALRGKDKPVKCSLCRETFLNKCYLVVHKAKHCLARPGRGSSVNPILTPSKGESQSTAKTGQNGKSKTAGISLAQEVRKRTEVNENSSDRKSYVHICEYCGHTFKRKSNLQNHLAFVHDTTEYICEVCSKVCIGKGKYKRHKKKHLHSFLKQVQCDLCSETCSSNYQLQRHKKNDHGIPMVQEPGTFCCEKCGGFYKTRNSLRSHIKDHCSGVARNRKVTFPRERKFSCEICGKSYFDKKYLNVHKRNIHSSKKVFCDVCNRAFKYQKILNGHKRFVHQKVRPHKCDICPRAFANGDVLRTHKRSHSGEKPYVCEVCGKAYVSPANLHRHKETHSGVRRFPCQFCQKRFYQKVTKDEHEMYHTKKWKHNCQDCGRGFGSPWRLQVHQKVHMQKKIPYKPRQRISSWQTGTMIKKNSDNMFVCSTCGKKYKSYGSLYVHRKVHAELKPFTCTICDRRFMYKGVLKQHMLIHTTKERLHQCTLCDAKFSSLPNMKRHERTIHHGIKLFSCDECGKSFGQKAQVFNHKKTNHKDSHTTEESSDSEVNFGNDDFVEEYIISVQEPL